MSLEISRRAFVGGGLTAAGLASGSAIAAAETTGKLPTVRWGEHEITRLLVGLCSHNHEVIDYAENRNWDVDFYQCCFYRSLFDLDATKRRACS